MSCKDCKMLLREDSGYSNWTVVDVTLSCMKKINPLMPCNDSADKLGEALDFGNNCQEKIPGYGPWFDVDGEVTIEDYKYDPIITDAYAKFMEKT